MNGGSSNAMASTRTRPPGEDAPWLTDELWDQPDGTVEDCGGDRYLVRSEGVTYRIRKGEAVAAWLIQGQGREYRCDTAEITCTCKHHAMRLVPGERCKHLKAVNVTDCEKTVSQGTREGRAIDGYRKGLVRIRSWLP